MVCIQYMFFCWLMLFATSTTCFKIGLYKFRYPPYHKSTINTRSTQGLQTRGKLEACRLDTSNYRPSAALALTPHPVACHWIVAAIYALNWSRLLQLAPGGVSGMNLGLVLFLTIEPSLTQPLVNTDLLKWHPTRMPANIQLKYAQAVYVQQVEHTQYYEPSYYSTIQLATPKHLWSNLQAVCVNKGSQLYLQGSPFPDWWEWVLNVVKKSFKEVTVLDAWLWHAGPWQYTCTYKCTHLSVSSWRGIDGKIESIA